MLAQPKFHEQINPSKLVQNNIKLFLIGIDSMTQNQILQKKFCKYYFNVFCGILRKTNKKVKNYSAANKLWLAPELVQNNIVQNNKNSFKLVQTRSTNSFKTTRIIA